MIKEKHDISLVQVYIDDTILDATNKSPCKDFSDIMQSVFEMSMMGELSYLVCTSIKQRKEYL